MQVIITRGIPASGKSTWAKEWVNKDPEHRVRINLDDIRKMFGKYWVPQREPLVTQVQKQILTTALVNNYDIVFDNTNMNEKVLNTITKLIKEASPECEIVYKDFFDVPLSECLKRDSERADSVSASVIKGFFTRYKDKYNLKE